ncbi:Uncharacterised protein [Mycobacteroides abscessus subsp. abscessus]|nr:Uncharacterised protein [Mycobacteroides abscessus subsp. abscessus]
MLTVQRQEDLRVHPAQTLQFQELAADRHLPGQHRELRTLACDGRVGFHRLTQQHFHRLRLLLGDHRDRIGAGFTGHRVKLVPLDNSGLLIRDRGQVWSEELDVVDAYGGDDGDRGVDDVGGIPAPTKPDLHHGDIDGRVGERHESHGDQHFELAHRGSALLLRLLVHQLHERFDLGVDLHVLRWRDRLSVNGNALHRGLQMRAGGAAGAPVQCRQERVDHPGHRGLAVGTRNMDARIRALRRAQQFHEGHDAIG